MDLPVLWLCPVAIKEAGLRGDQENKTSTQRYLKQIEDIRLYERGLAKLTDRYLATGRKDEKLEACVLSWLHNWAMTNAMVQAATTSTGKAVRKWFLASVTASYLQLNRQLNKDVHIHHWLSSIAEQVINDYEPYFEKPDRINNHLYWAGLGVMLTGVATRRSDFYQWGIDSYKQGVNKINENGFLATEMARGQRALAYHNFALVPLVMMAEIGACNGQRLYSLNNHAVERLANAVISGLDNDSLFAKNTGEKQLKAKVETSHGLAWLEPYYHRFGLPPSGKKRLEHLRPMKHSYLGGNLTQLYQPH